MNRRNQRLAVKTNERKGEFNIYKQTSTDSKLYSRYRRILAAGPVGYVCFTIPKYFDDEQLEKLKSLIK